MNREPLDLPILAYTSEDTMETLDEVEGQDEGASVGAAAGDVEGAMDGVDEVAARLQNCRDKKKSYTAGK